MLYLFDCDEHLYIYYYKIRVIVCIKLMVSLFSNVEMML